MTSLLARSSSLVLRLALFVTVAGCSSAPAADPPTAATTGTEVLWDRYGVPHIFAPDHPSLFQAYGYAQMEAHAELLVRLYAQAIGADAGELLTAYRRDRKASTSVAETAMDAGPRRNAGRAPVRGAAGAARPGVQEVAPRRRRGGAARRASTAGPWPASRPAAAAATPAPGRRR